MQRTMKPFLSTSILVGALLATPLAYSEDTKPGHGMEKMTGSQNGQMMDMGDTKNQMQGMSEMMKEAHATKDVNKRRELMQKHTAKMQGMMGDMKGMMTDKMPGKMNMEDRQKMMGKRMDMMQGILEQMLKQQSMMMNMDK